MGEPEHPGHHDTGDRRFHDGGGEFLDEEEWQEWQGVPVRVRFRCSGISATTAVWEQAFSRDRGRTWLTNSVMRSTKR